MHRRASFVSSVSRTLRPLLRFHYSTGVQFVSQKNNGVLAKFLIPLSSLRSVHTTPIDLSVQLFKAGDVKHHHNTPDDRITVIFCSPEQAQNVKQFAQHKNAMLFTVCDKDEQACVSHEHIFVSKQERDRLLQVTSKENQDLVTLYYAFTCFLLQLKTIFEVNYNKYSTHAEIDTTTLSFFESKLNIVGLLPNAFVTTDTENLQRHITSAQLDWHSLITTAKQRLSRLNPGALHSVHYNTLFNIFLQREIITGKSTPSTKTDIDSSTTLATTPAPAHISPGAASNRPIIDSTLLAGEADDSKTELVLRAKVKVAPELYPVHLIHPHEKIITGRLEQVADEISSGFMYPVIADIRSKILIDGHHRYNYMKLRGYSHIWVQWVDYESPEISCLPWPFVHKNRNNNGIFDTPIPTDEATHVPPETNQHAVVEEEEDTTPESLRVTTLDTAENKRRVIELAKLGHLLPPKSTCHLYYGRHVATICTIKPLPVPALVTDSSTATANESATALQKESTSTDNFKGTFAISKSGVN